MTIAISTGLANLILDAITNDGTGTNFDSGILELRSGAAPGPDEAASGTLLASIDLDPDAFLGAGDRAVFASGTWQDAAADAGGTAAHFRLRQSGDGNGASTTAIRMEGAVTVSGGGGDLELSSALIVLGQPVIIDSFVIAS